MDRNKATSFCRDKLLEHGLKDWHVRISTDATKPFLGLCSYKDKCIILNAHHIDIHPEPDVVDTVLHEVAHALTPGYGHDDVWRTKAKELGCTSLQPCSHLSLSPEVIDAIRSGAEVKVEFEEEVIRHPKYTVTRLQDKCSQCGRVAKEKSSAILEAVNKKIITLECGHKILRDLPKQTPYQTFVSHGWKESVKNCKHEFDKSYQCTKCGEYTARPYQVDGMRFLETALAVQRGGAIFDEMGLGKTIQALGYLNFNESAFPVLFIIKSGIKYQWLAELIRWLGPQFAGQVIQSGKDYIIPGLKTYFMSYDIIVPKSRTGKSGKKIEQGLPLEKLVGLGIKTIVLDECQQIKNPDSTRTQMLRRLIKDAGIEKIIPLSGTPWKNRGSEFFTVLNMLAPMKFYSYQGFLDRWVDFYYAGNTVKQGGIKNPEEFKEYIKDIAIRRERCDVMKELPLITRALHYTEIDPTSQQAYDEEVSDFVKFYNEQVIGGDEDKMYGVGGPLIARLARMRHITGLSKIPATEAFVKDFVEETDRKMVIFVHHQDVGHILYENLKKEHGKNIPVLKLTGGMNAEERFRIQEEFNKSPRALMVASTLAAGEGLNLQTCCDCILHERQWNPANEEQAEGRFIRIGQKSDAVNAWYITASATVDEHLAGIVERKRVDFHNAMNKGQMPQWKEQDIIKELSEKLVKEWAEKNKKKAS